MKKISRKPWILVAVFNFLLVLNLTISISAQSQPKYVPAEHITLACGSSGDTTGLDGRKWTADANNKFLVGDQNPSTSSQASQQPDDSIDKAPYLTARLSRSEFSYSFPVTSGSKFLRLYFYPFNYPGFNKSDAFFSVKSNSFTLLSNFSADIHARAYEVQSFYREFCLVIQEGERLNISFSPSLGMPDAYAFVNAIEIMSMPAYLYYSPTDVTKFPVNLDPSMQSNPSGIFNDTAMEMMYRVNVGGSPISAKDDTGLFRNWYEDSEYLTIDVSSTLPVNTSIPLNLKNVGNYTAPDDVYKTARSMGTNKTVNDNYALTWEFKVDSSFTYLVRLHFCEFQPPIQQVGDRVYRINIANESADGHADVIEWSGGNGIPVYKDYEVMILPKANEKQQNLSVALRTVSWRLTAYSDAILNGLELFKLSNFDKNLAAPNPDIVPNPSDSTPATKSTKSKSSSKTTAIIVGSVAGGLVVLSLLFLFIFRRKLKVKDSASSSDTASKWGLHSFSTTKSSKTHGSSLPSDLCRRFSLAEIKAATNNFDEVFVIGVGGFGNVFKGFINDGSTTVAIKRLNPESQQGAREFKTEIEMLSQLRHVHLVSLIGYCNEDNEMVLVYDYMARGTLRDHLYKTDNPPLSWYQRLEICIGAAKGLLYLHSGAKHTIIHRDVKTTNILLDEKWGAKVSDFGLSKVGPANMANAHVSTVVKGSFGYLDPEYYRLQRLTEKSDVYSFGVVLCEVLCARPPINRTATKQPVSLAEWVRQSYRTGNLNDIVVLPERSTVTVRVSIFRASDGLPLTGYEEQNNQSGYFNFQRPSSATSNDLGEFTPERPHFFKIILEESEAMREKKLLIPTRFVRIYGHDISTYVQVKDPSGRKWKLEWTKSDGETWFKNGWQEFVDFYSIVHGHVLVFEYEGGSQFSVVIFDKSATEIKYPVTRTHDVWQNQDGSFQEVTMEETDQDELETEISDDFTLSSEKGKKSPVNHSRTGFSNDENCGHRGVDVRTEQFKVNEKSNAFKKAAAFKSQNPFFSIVLQFSYVIPISARLRIPASFYIDHITKDEGIAMLYSNGRRWDVRYLSNGRKEKKLHAVFGTGWKIFARENHLKVGDVCIFELINNINLTFKVHIYRVDESIDPCPSIRKRTQVTDEKVVNKKPKTRDVQLKEDRIIESANRFSSKNPFFRVIMQPHYLSSPYLDIPIDFAEKHFKQVRKDALLEVGRRSWTVQVFAPGRFCGGWSTFVKANSLREKDVCIFELVETTSLVMKVHIFRGTDC